jgi:TadE-like protein
MTTFSAKPIAPKKRQRGVAAVEAALILPIFVTLLTAPVYYGRCLWHYTVAQKAAQDATRYLAQVSAAEMRSAPLAQAASNTALAIARAEIAELAPGSVMGTPSVYCDNVPCTSLVGILPSTVGVFIRFSMRDNVFGIIDDRFGLVITANASMRYVGN